VTAPSPIISKIPRIAALDVARGVAVIGALLIHVLIACDVWVWVPQNAGKAVANTVFRSFTPTFFILFGVMLELVYVQRLERDRKPPGNLAAEPLLTAGVRAHRDMAKRLVSRAGWCWLGFTAGAAAAACAGNISLTKFFNAAVLLGDAPWSSVLRFYVLALIIAIPLVHARCRIGWLFPWLLITGIWVIDPLLTRVHWPWSGEGQVLRFFWGSLTGYPPVWIGGSVWHNLTLVALGMGLGFHLRRRAQRGLSPFPWSCAAVVAGLCLAVLALSVFQLGWRELLIGYAGDSMALRARHHPAYFAGGALSALALIAGIFCVVRGDGGLLAIVGRRSLLAFSLGGVLVNLVPRQYAFGWAAGLAMVVAQLAATLLLVGLCEIHAQRRKKT